MTSSTHAATVMALALSAQAVSSLVDRQPFAAAADADAAEIASHALVTAAMAVDAVAIFAERRSISAARRTQRRGSGTQRMLRQLLWTQVLLPLMLLLLELLQLLF